MRICCLLLKRLSLLLVTANTNTIICYLILNYDKMLDNLSNGFYIGMYHVLSGTWWIPLLWSGNQVWCCDNIFIIIFLISAMTCWSLTWIRSRPGHCITSSLMYKRALPSWSLTQEEAKSSTSSWMLSSSELAIPLREKLTTSKEDIKEEPVEVSQRLLTDAIVLYGACNLYGGVLWHM